MTNADIRWKQRFQNFEKAFFNLKSAVNLYEKRDLSELESQGLIQSFEFTFELSWKVLKDYLQLMRVEAKFPRDVMKQAFQYDLIDDGDLWMDMLEKRSLMVHTYDEKNANLAVELITQSYFGQIQKLYSFYGEQVDVKTALDLSSKLNEAIASPYHFNIISGSTIDHSDLTDHIQRVGKQIYQRSHGISTQT